MAPASILEAFMDEARLSGADFVRLGIAWARVLPTALFVPAFGLGFLGVPVRVVMAFGLAAALAPALSPDALPPGGAAWLPAVLAAFLRGVPVAVAASVSLWAAMVAGGVADTATGSARLRVNAGSLGPRAAPFSTLLALFAAVAFFETGGASRIVTRLSETAGAPLEQAVRDLSAGVGTGAAIGAPFLVVSAVLDVSTEFARLDRPAVVTEAAIAALRSLAVLIASAALFERVAEGIVLFGSSGP